MPSSVEEISAKNSKYAPGTPISERVKGELRDKIWNLMDLTDRNVLMPVINYGWTAGAGAIAGAFMGHPIEGAIIGAGARALPWATRKYVSNPWYVIPEGMVGIVFDHGKVFKDETAYTARNLLEQVRDNMKFQNIEGIAELAFYKDQWNREYFMPMAKVVGPGRHYKYPGTTYVRVESDEYRVDPPSRPVQITSKKGVKIEMNHDLVLFYNKLPIPFAINYRGRLLRKDPDWEKDLEKKLGDEAYNSMIDFFKEVRFPDSLQTSLSETTKDRINRRVAQSEGVRLRILEQGNTFHHSQEGVLKLAMQEMQNDTEWGAMCRSDFTHVVELIYQMTQGKEFSSDFFRLIEQYRKFREGSLERFTLSPEPSVSTA